VQVLLCGQALRSHQVAELCSDWIWARSQPIFFWGQVLPHVQVHRRFFFVGS